MPVLRNVEIFKAGTWNTHSYTQDDLDTVVRTFGKRDVAITINHATPYCDMAFVTALRREGDTLLADLEIPPDVLREFQLGVYSGVSAMLTEDCELYHLALVTGPENCPAVQGLKAITLNLEDLES